jgi:hypothetical protein
MDKNLHKNIGDVFSKEINLLSQEPREHIWDQIEKQLDKTDARVYKDKFIQFRKRSLLSLLLLIGVCTFSLVYMSSRVGQKNISADFSSKLNGQKKANTTGSTAIKNLPGSKESLLPQLSPDTGNANGPDEKRGIFYKEKKTLGHKASYRWALRAPEAENDELPSPQDAFNNNWRSSLPLSAATIDYRAALAAIITKPQKLTMFKPGNDIPGTEKSHQQGNRENRYMLMGIAGPEYSKYLLANSSRSNYDYKSDIATRERSDLSASAGLLFGRKVNRRMTVFSGFIYSLSNISISPSKFFAEEDNAGKVKYRYNTSTGYGYLLPSFSQAPAVGDSLHSDGANHTLHYLGVPVIAKYAIGNKKISFHPGVGVTLNFLTKSTLTVDVIDRQNRETESISRLQGIKKFVPGIIIIPEVQYKLSKKWSLAIVPSLKYSVSAINKGNVVKTRPYTIGIGAGMVFKF